jgi:hypothetical protein
MLDVAFLILKILGIILLVIMGILLIAISVVMMFPAQYRIVADAAGNLERTSLVAKMYWLFHLVSAEASYKNGQFDWKARFFWMTESDIESFAFQDKSQESTENHTEEYKEIEKAEYYKEELTEEKKQKKDKRIKKSDKKFLKKWIEKIRYTFHKICDKIKKILKVKDEILEFVQNETHRSSFRKLKNEIFLIFKHYRPRKMKGYIRFGFEDPYHTGQTLAALSLVYPFYGKDVDVHPEFEQEILEGHLVIRGRIRVVHLLRLVSLWIFDKDIKQTYQYFTNLKL